MSEEEEFVNAVVAAVDAITGNYKARIEALESDNAKLRAALTEIYHTALNYEDKPYSALDKISKLARAASSEKK